MVSGYNSGQCNAREQCDVGDFFHLQKQRSQNNCFHLLFLPFSSAFIWIKKRLPGNISHRDFPFYDFKQFEYWRRESALLVIGIYLESICRRKKKATQEVIV